MTGPRFLLVGAGVIGAHHAGVMDQLSDRLELVGVVDPHLDRAQALADPRGVPAHPDLGGALSQATPDVVVVCTPTGTHGELAVRALRAGCHVIVEKPAEITPERIDEIIEARDAAGRTVTVVSQHRFDPATELVLDRIATGELGTVVSGIAAVDWYRTQEYYDSGEWRGTWELDGGGALMNQGIHTVDLLVAALGRPVQVVARTATRAHERIDVEDVAVAVVQFESGALGVVHATTAAYPGMSARLQVAGSAGSAVIDDDALRYLHTRAGEVIGDADNQADRFPAAATPPPVASGADPSSLSRAHVWQYENLLAALRGEQDVRVTLEDNRRSVALITAVYESARTGRPVDL